MPQQQYASKTIVISGGTDGMGRGLALARLRRGDTVVAIGTKEAKGAGVLGEAERLGAGNRFHFVRADLSSIANAERVVTRIAAEHPVIDALVLCANRQSPKRRESAEGLEFTFSLYYVSRYLLGHGLRAQFDAAAKPVIINFASPGLKIGSVNFDDLQAEKKYSAIRAQAQCGRANDLLGRAFADQPSSRASYVLYHPGFTATLGSAGDVGRPARAILTFLAKVAAKPVDKAIAPMIDVIDSPPAARLTAVDRGKNVDLSIKTFDPADARRLAEVTRRLVREAYGDTRLLPELDPTGNPG